jgi:hypothetical protein
MNYHLLENDIREQLIKSPHKNLSFCERLFLWGFFHSSPGFYSSYEYDSQNMYWCCPDCCPRCLELEFTGNKCCKKDCLCFLVCCTFRFV